MRLTNQVRLLAVCCWALPALAQAPPLEKMDLVLKSVPDGPVAKVNGVNISAAEFSRLYRTEIAALVMQAEQKPVPDQVRIETGLQCLTVLVQREILLQEARKRKLSVTDQELQRAWEDQLQRAARSVTKPSETAPTEAELLEWTGLTRDQALAEVREEMLIEKARQAILAEKGVTVTNAEVEAFFKEKKHLFKRPDQCHVKQIFVGFGPEKTAENTAAKLQAREKIEKAVQRIRAGESFEAVAKSASEAPGKENGGDLGMLPLAALPPFYVEAASSLQAGQMSEIIESPLGFHVIKLIDVVSGADADLEKAEPYIRKMLLAQKGNKAVEAFCEPILRKKGTVQVFLELDKTIATHPDAAALRRPTPDAATGQASPDQ